MANASTSQLLSLLSPPLTQTLPAELDRVVRLVDARPEALAGRSRGGGDTEMYAAALAA
ncbi:hypothetical protein FRC07_000357, partial [Ceratobasidium sp. 392]